jgi:hypothetical protein
MKITCKKNYEHSASKHIINEVYLSLEFVLLLLFPTECSSKANGTMIHKLHPKEMQYIFFHFLSFNSYISFSLGVKE